MAKGSRSFVGVQLHTNRTPTGRPSIVAVRQAAHYVAYGQRHSHEAVLAWGQDEARAHRFTVHAVLSVPHVRLSADDYRLALAADEDVSRTYRLMVYEDTRYSHAHALFFWDKRMEKEQYLQWQADVQAVLVEREAVQMAVTQELATGQEEESGQTRRQAWELEF
jgi:hypothetical protein